MTKNKSKAKKTYALTQIATTEKGYSEYVYGKGAKAVVRDSRSIGKGRPANVFEGQLLTEIRKYVTSKRVKGQKVKKEKTGPSFETVFLTGEKKTVLFYGSREVPGTKGQPKRILDGIPLTKVVKYTPEKREKGSVEIETSFGPKHNEYVYSDGTVVSNVVNGVTAPGRPKLVLNGANLVKVIRFTPEKIGKEEKKIRKETKHRKLVAALPTRIPVISELISGQEVFHFSKVNNEDNFINKIKIIEIKKDFFGKDAVFAEFLLDGKLTVGPVKVDSLRV